MDVLKIYRNFNQALADGLNSATRILARDIQDQVPVRTGRLRAGYRVSELAKPGSLHTQIGPSQKYGAKFYPFTQNFGRRQAQRPARVRFFGGPEPVYQERRKKLVSEQISIKLGDWINGR